MKFKTIVSLPEGSKDCEESFQSERGISQVLIVAFFFLTVTKATLIAMLQEKQLIAENYPM